ncbi:origin recognition complex subunit 2 [Palaemon carinicauda]|uniref:origin recognition complex subunit 2 n=1 Tax=Palaemon carinicauda TaxID=392227 RepID=UPI0035B68810
MAPRSERSSIRVIFVDDGKVTKIRNSKDNPEVEPLGEHGKNKNSGNATRLDGLPPVDEEEETEKDVLLKPTELLEEAKNMPTGSSIYYFNTPKKRLSMFEKADSAKKVHMSPSTPRTPKTPRIHQSSGSRTPKTPKTPLSAAKVLLQTPKSRKSLSNVVEDPKTPYSFRKRVKQHIKKIVYKEESSSSEEEEDSGSDCDFNLSESDDSDQDKENNDEWTSESTPKRLPLRSVRALSRTPSRQHPVSLPSGTPGRTPSRVGRGRKVKDVEMVAKADDYFSHQSDAKKIATSDHTLNHLQTPRLSPEALQTLLNDVTALHPLERKNLLESHVQMFSQWMISLCENFSIFLYGLGSKKLLISQFQEQYLSDFDNVVINGFFPSLTLKSVLNTITEDILDHTGSFHSSNDQLEFIQNAYESADAEPLFIVVHNLDGPMLRSDKVQTTFASLASLSRVHLIASIDHINAPLIFDSGKMSSYNALWFDATTLAPYSEETSYENSLLVQQSGALALSSLIHVFKSLTPNAKGIFLMLARYQLDQKDNSNYAGLSFSDMYQRCRETFLVNSDLTLRAQLTEFKDHKLIRSKKGHDGTEHLLIPLDSNTLEDFMAQEDS